VPRSSDAQVTDAKFEIKEDDSAPQLLIT